METLTQPVPPADRPSPMGNPFSGCSLAALFGGIPLSLILASGRGWDGLVYLLLGIPASVGLAFVLGLIAWLRGESLGAWAMGLPVTAVIGFLLLVNG